MPIRVLRITEEEWLERVMEKRVHLKIDMSGLPFRYSPPVRWDTGIQRLSQHLVYFAAKGRFSGKVEGREVIVSTGEFCWVNPGAAFQFSCCPQEPPPVLRRFRFSLLCGVSSWRVPWDFRVCRASNAFEWAKSLVSEAESPAGGDVCRIKALATLFFLDVFRSHRTPLETAPRRLSSEVISKAAELVTENPSGRPNPADLARKCGFSPDYFTRLFRQSLGTSPRKWILQQRLRHAAVMLAESDMRISEVAEQHGYRDLFLFSRQFKSEFGKSPRAWRIRPSTGSGPPPPKVRLT